MTPKRHKIPCKTAIGLVSAWALGFGACSTVEIEPVAPSNISPPPYVQVLHPQGFDVSDLHAAFAGTRGFDEESLKTCDADFTRLKKLTQSDEEIRQGARELVKSDPVFYHTCFYGKILELETALRSTSYIEEKQKKVLTTYAFLVPLARGFLKEYRDSRYLRWAIRHYRGLSEWVFYRKLNQAPEMTAELTEVTNPFGLWREPAATGSVLDKYHLRRPESKTPSPAPAPAAVPPVSEYLDPVDISSAVEPEPDEIPEAPVTPTAKAVTNN